MTNQTLPKDCPVCDASGTWIVTHLPLNTRIHDTIVEIRAEVTACRSCGFNFLTDKQVLALAGKIRVGWQNSITGETIQSVKFIMAT
jgi:hypothetical protein